MPRTSFTKQTNFASGELSAALTGRTDLDRYYNGAAIFLNWSPIVQGGARRAAGTEFSLELWGKTRLYGFSPAAEIYYLFIFASGTLNIYLKSAGTIAYVETFTGQPWDDDSIFEMDIKGALDTVIIAHNDFAPRRVYRTSLLVFDIEDLSNTSNSSGVFLENIPTEPPLATRVEETYYLTDAYIKPNNNDATGYYYQATRDAITGTSTAVSFNTVIGGITNDGDQRWECIGTIEGVEQWSASNGWPGVCTFFQQRLLFAAATSFPNRVALSRSGKYYDFDLYIGLGTDAIDREILVDEMPVIQWAHSGRSLVLGGTTGEFANTQREPVTPSNIVIDKQTSIGSAKVQPVSVDGSTLHVTLNRKQLRDLVYSDTEDALVTRSVSIMSPEAVTNAVQVAAKSAVDYDSANTVYVANEDGALGVLHLLRDQDFLAWSRRTFTDATVDSVAALGEEVFVVINWSGGTGVYEEDTYEDDTYEEGTSKRLLCKFSDDLNTDFSETQTSTPAKTEWSGYNHLASATVQLIGDGAYLGTGTVSAGGLITTPVEVSTLTVGVAIPPPTLKLMPASFSGTNGDISLLKKRLVEYWIELQDTESIYINGDQIPLREADDNVGSPVSSFTGIKRGTKIGRDYEATLTITAPEPLPVTVKSVTRKVMY